MTPSDVDSPATRRLRRRRVLVAVAVVVGVLAIAVVVLFLMFRRQTVSYVTHWKGEPEHTQEWRPHEPPPPVHLAAIGDSGDSGRRLDATTAAMAELGATEPYDALLLLGDNVYPSGAVDQLQETVFQPFSATLAQGTDLLAILGNHDVMQGTGDQQMTALGMEGRYWSRTIGDTLLIGLDTNDLDRAQLDWLDRTLEGSDATWKIVALHHPPYSAGYQGSLEELRTSVVPILERHGVQLVLSGHDHDYQRSKEMGGITYVVSGAGSGTRRTAEKDFTALSFSWLHFLDIAVYPERLVVRAVGTDGTVGDEFTLTP